MPAKNTTYKTGKRNLIFSKDLFDTIRKELNSDISDKEIRDIILDSNKVMSDIVSDSDDVLKLPENLGYIAVTKYKSKKRPIDFHNTRLLKKTIPLLNLHSFNYIHHIKWFKRSDSQFGIKKVYKLEPTRELKRSVAKNCKAGKLYSEWNHADFWNINKISKKFKK